MGTLTRSVACIAVVCLSTFGALTQTNLRGWHADGQTWLIWEHSESSSDTYRVYASDREIKDLNQAELIGRVFREDWKAARLKLAGNDLNWTVPNGAGGRYTLNSNEALFVSTPHSSEAQYFAVVPDGETSVDPGNRIGPIHQNTDPVQCHLQASGFAGGHAYRIYAHWIDGRNDWKESRSDYPVMGNEYFNGTAHVFRIWEPLDGESRGLVPAVVA